MEFTFALHIFIYSKSLKRFEIKSSDFMLYTYPFEGVSSLETIVLPDDNFSKNVIKLYDYAYTTDSAIVQPASKPDFLIQDDVLIGYFGDETDVHIPENVSEIGSYAFKNRKIRSVSFPDSVLRIDNSAFHNCTSLTGPLALPNQLTSIGERAFQNCTSLQGPLVIPDLVEKIGTYAFNYCSAMNGRIVLPENLTALERYVLPEGTNVEELEVRCAHAKIEFSEIAHLNGLQKITFRASDIGGYKKYPLSVLKSLSVIEVPFESYSEYLQLLGTMELASSVQIIPFDKPDDSGDLFIDTNGVLKGYFGEASEVTLPSGVKEIGPGAFFHNQNLTKINFPDGLEKISDYAFENCENLTEADLPDTVKIIGDNAFCCCKMLKRIQISASVEAIGSYAFSTCTALSGGLEFSSSVQKIGDYAFNGCTGLNGSLLIGAETIGSGAFYNCRQLSAVDFLPSVRSIGSRAFYECSGLKGDLILPEGLKEIGDSAFYYCIGLDGQLYIPQTLEKLESRAFLRCLHLKGNIVLPEAITKLGDYTFSNMWEIESIDLPEGLTAIGNQVGDVFSEAGNVKKIIFRGLQVPATKSNEFSGMKSLETIEVPYSSIGLYKAAYSQYLNSLTQITVAEPQEPFVCVGNKLIAYLGEEIAVTIPDGITEIGTGAFQNNQTIVSVELPDSIISIGDYAFSGCVSLEHINLPNNLTQIGQSAFKNCSVVKMDMNLPESVQIIGPQAFYGCAGIEGEIRIPDSVKSIGEGTFFGMGLVDSLILGSGLETIDARSNTVFKNMSLLRAITFQSVTPPALSNGNPFSSLSDLETIFVPLESVEIYQNTYGPLVSSATRFKAIEANNDYLVEDGVLIAYQGEDENLVIPDGITAIAGSVFLNNTSIQSVVLPDSLKEIGDLAFKGAANLTSISFPSQLESIGSQAFMNCSSLAEVILPDSISSIGAECFRNCSMLTKAVIGSSLDCIPERCFMETSSLNHLEFTSPDVSVIDQYAFYKSGIKQIELPEKLKRIENYAFAECNALEGELLLPQELEHIGQYAFYKDTSLTGNLLIPESVITIGASAFENCKRMTGNLQLGSNVESIGSSAFDSTGFGGRIILPESVRQLGSYSFSSMSNLEEFEFNTSISNISTTVSECKKLKKLVIRNPKFTVTGSSFNNTESLERVVIPNQDFSTNSNAVYYRLSNESNRAVVWPESVPDDFLIVNGTLIGYFGEESYVTIPEKVHTIGDYAFMNRDIIQVDFPTGLRTVGNYAFYNCRKLSGSLIIPDSVESLGKCAFYGCESLNEKIVLPANLKELQKGSHVFVNCLAVTELEINCTNAVLDVEEIALLSRLKKITFRSASVPQLTSSYMIYMDSLEEIAVPYQSYCEYTQAFSSIAFPEHAVIIPYDKPDGAADFFIDENGKLIAYAGSDTEVQVPEGVREIGKSVFRNRSDITIVSLPDGVVRIGFAAFQRCTGLQKINLPDTVTVIGDHAFYKCEKLKEIHLPKALEEIEDFAFSCCTSLSGGLDIPSSTKRVGKRSFEQCSGMKGVLRIGAEIIDENAFWGCYGFSSLVILPSVKTIKGAAFYHCYGFEGDLIFPEGVEEIGALSFAYCYGFDGTIYLPNSLTKLSQNAFQDCIKIKGDLIVPEGITTVYDITFENMKCIERIIFPESLIKIGDYNGRVLTNMTSVKEIVFKGTQVPPVRMNEFKTLTSLQTIYVPASALEDYKNAYGSLVNEGVEFKTDTLVLPVSGLKADEVYSRSARISWFPHSSPSVTHYRVLVNNEPAGETEETTWQLSNLTEGESCKVTVTGLTDTGEESASTSITVIPRSLPVCEIRTSLGSDEVSVSDSTIYGLLDNSEKINPTQIRNLKGAFYYKDGEEEVLIGEAVFNPLLHTSLRIFMETRSDISQLENGSYEVIFRVTDPDGVQSEMTKTITVDRSVPSVIEGVRAEPDVDKILVSWRMAKEANVTTYRIYRRTGETGSFYIIGRVEGRENLTFQDKQVGNTEKYYYYVTAINRIKEESAPSEPAGATLNTDDEAPTMIRMLPKNGMYLTGQIRIELFAEDNVGVSRTRLEISTDNRKTWQSLGQAAGDHGVLSLDTTQYEDGLIYLKAVAEDEAGNVSEPLIYAFSIDNTGPGKPENLSYESTSVSITLRWNDLADQDLSHYEVQQKNAEGEFVTIQDHIQTVGTNINQLNPETEYTFRIRGVDLNGNTGIWSDEIICSTSRDTTRPVITRIRPLSGAYNRLIPFSVRAQDDYSIRTIILQSSVDGRTWTDLTSLDYVEDGAVREWGHSVELDDFEEGSLYLRAVAVDASGNTSDTSSAAPCVQYRIDRTAPAAPEGLMARAQNGAIEISWEQGTEEDLNTYSVYRSTSEDGEYQLLAPGLSTLNYWDRTAQADTLYYYKAAVSDQAGNLSEFSFAVSAQVDPDTEAPVIINTAPSSGERIGTGYRKLRVLASDNRSVASMHLAFSHDGQTWIPGPVIQGKNSARELLEAELSLTDWSDGENMTVQITLEDGAGNTSEPVVLNYVIDKSAPVIVSLQGSYNEEKVTLRWQSGQESDLSGYRIYRKRASASDSSYRLVGQQKADGSLNYVFDDFSISETADDYIYRIEASDDCGNTAQSVTETIHVPDRTNNGLPVPVLNCDAIMEAGVEYIIDASGSTDDSRIVSWHIDFGDGTSSEEASPIHVYEQSGTYTITLTVTDDENNMATLEKTVEVRDVNLAGTARIRVIDEYNIAVPNAPVYFDLGEETQVVKKTDRDGYVTFTADAGRHMVGCLIPNNEWLPAKREMIVSPGTETSIALRLIRYPMLEGSFEVTRMTFEEIEAAGIDLSDSENQHMLQVNVHLTYGKEEINTSFLYNESTGISINRPCVITVGSEQRKTTCYGYKITKPDDPEQYEMAVAILDLPVEATALKEFFDVKLHIINNAASDFVMENNTVTLKVPEGLTIMNAEGYASGAAVSIPSIPCQSQKTVSWMVRGMKWVNTN